MGWRLDPDLRAFYLHCNGAELIEPLPDSSYRILPLVEIVRARVARSFAEFLEVALCPRRPVYWLDGK